MTLVAYCARDRIHKIDPWDATGCSQIIEIDRSIDQAINSFLASYNRQWIRYGQAG